MSPAQTTSGGASMWRSSLNRMRDLLRRAQNSASVGDGKPACG
jgi:hypothetical protein